jgi:hypothetical protein
MASLSSSSNGSNDKCCSTKAAPPPTGAGVGGQRQLQEVSEGLTYRLLSMILRARRSGYFVVHLFVMF